LTGSAKLVALASVAVLFLGALSAPVLALSDSARPSSSAPSLGIGPVSVMLLMDNSGSMPDSDPKGLRWEAARYFVDFLSGGCAASGQTHRAGLILFETLPVLWSDFKRVDQSTDLIKREIDEAQGQPPGGATNFAGAVGLADSTIRLHEAQEPGRCGYAAVFFTDGVADPPDKQYERIRDTLATLAEGLGSPVEVFVVIVGEGWGDASSWRSALGEGPDRQRVFRVESPEDYFGAFGAIGASLLGMTPGDPTIVEGGQTDTVNVPAYLENLVLSVFKQGDIKIEIWPADDEGQAGATPFKAVPPDYVVSGNAYDILSICHPPPHGSWTIVATGSGTAFIWSAWSAAQLWLQRPGAVSASRRPLEFWMDLVYPRSLEPVPIDEHYPLDLRVSMVGPEGPKVWIVSPEVDRAGHPVGSFRETLTPAPVDIGPWQIEVMTKASIAAQVVPPFSTTVYVDALPILGKVTLESRLLTLGRLAAVTAEIEGDEPLDRLAISWELRDTWNRSLVQARLYLGDSGRYEASFLVPVGPPEAQGVDQRTGPWAALGRVYRWMSPHQGDGTMSVVLAGVYRPPGAPISLRYQDPVIVDVTLARPLGWFAGILVVLIGLQALALYPGRPRVGRVSWEGAGGQRGSGTRFSTARAAAGTVIKAAPQMLTRFHWRGVQVRASIWVDGVFAADVPPGDQCDGIPGDDAPLTVYNGSVSGRQAPPLGLPGTILAAVFLAASVLIAAIILSGLIVLPGLAPKLLALAYLADFGAIAWWFLRAQTAHSVERSEEY